MYLSEFGLFVIRITGMVMFVSGFIELPDYINHFLKNSEASSFSDFMSIVFVPAGMSIFTGLFLIVFPANILKIMVPNKKQKIVDDNSRLFLNDRIAIVGLSLYLMFESMSDLVFHIASIFVLKSSITGGFPIGAYNYPVVIASFVEIIFSALLIWKSEYISIKINNRSTKSMG